MSVACVEHMQCTCRVVLGQYHGPYIEDPQASEASIAFVVEIKADDAAGISEGGL